MMLELSSSAHIIQKLYTYLVIYQYNVLTLECKSQYLNVNQMKIFCGKQTAVLLYSFCYERLEAYDEIYVDLQHKIG
jgi:hypothetical protein